MGRVLRKVSSEQEQNRREKMNSILATVLSLLFIFELGSCGHYYRKYWKPTFYKNRYSPPSYYPSRSQPSKSVFNTLVSDSRFPTLVAAVTAAGLTEEAINDLGPLTIFAPTNDAFAKIPSDVLGGLLEDVPALTEILLRHVVPKNIVKLYKAEMSYDNAGGSKVTVNGYKVSTSAASAMVTGKVTATDGMVYAIDTVI